MTQQELNVYLFSISIFGIFWKGTLVISLIHSGLAIPFIHCVFDIWVHPISDLSTPMSITIILSTKVSGKYTFFCMVTFIFSTEFFLPFESIFLKRTSLNPTCISCQAMVTDTFEAKHECTYNFRWIVEFLSRGKKVS